jgi:hypothetical protein
MKEAADTINDYLPTSGWLGKYLKFTEGLEICPRFRFFSACVVLGAAINNKVWIQRGDEGLLPKLFPNLWAVLLAPPGRGHKTTAINMAVNALSEACEDVRVLADKLTPEYLVKALSAPVTKKDIIRIGPRDATGLIKAPEMSVFFGRQQYNVGLVSLITDLYDYRPKWTGGTIGRGGEVLLNVCISILAGSTPQWLQRMLPEDAFTGGFMSRFVIVEMPPGYFKKVPHPRKPKDVEWKHIVNELHELSGIRGIAEWGPGAVEAYDKCYEELLPVGDPQQDAYRERVAEQILKIAMLLAISEGSTSVTGKYIMQARDTLKALETETNPRIERLTTHPRMQLVQDIVDQLKIHGELDEGELLKKVYRSLSQGERQFFEALSVLQRTRAIYYKGKPGSYRYGLVGVSNDNKLE